MKTNDVPMASGLDDWWRTAASNVDAAEREKAAIAAEDFQQERAYRYLASGAQDKQEGEIR